MNKITHIIIHHFGGTDADPLADTSNQTFEVVNEYHRQKWNFVSSLGYYCGYQYVIEKDGKITQARADTETGAHAIGHNDSSIGIALAGNFDLTMPTQAQIEALKPLINSLRDKYNILLENVVPHRKFANKTCFGRLLSDDWVIKLLTPIHVAVKPCMAEEKIIESQKKQIFNLQTLIANLIKYFNLK